MKCQNATSLLKMPRLKTRSYKIVVIKKYFLFLLQKKSLCHIKINGIMKGSLGASCDNIMHKLLAR